MQVLELLLECVKTVEAQEDEFACKIYYHMKSEFGQESVEKFVKQDEEYIKNNPNEYKKFIEECAFVGINIRYMIYLREIADVDTEKAFCLVIDRDENGTALDECLKAVDKLKEELKKDKDNGEFHLYLSSPCFDFWLLLHYTDCQTGDEYLSKIKENKNDFTIKQVSEYAHHGKSNFSFKNKYLNKVDTAIKNSQLYETKIEKIREGIGTNLADLFAALREK